MTKARATISKPVPEVRFWACFAVVFALVAQVLFPIQAMAMPNSDGSAYTLCTGDADVTVTKSTRSQPAKGIMGLKCADCVLSSITAVQTVTPVVLPVRQPIAHAIFRPAAQASCIKARAPPRPHSCGPPSQFQA